MEGQIPVLLIVGISVIVGILFLMRRFKKQAEYHVMAYFRIESGDKIGIRLPVMGHFVVAPRKFGQKGTMRYGIREDATWDEPFPAGIPKLLQTKIKAIDYLEGDPEPFIKRDRLVEMLDDTGQKMYVDLKPIITPTLMGTAADEKSGDVAMRATARITELEDKLAKTTNTKMTLIFIVVAAAAAGASVYFIYSQVIPMLQKLMAAAGVG